MSEKLGPRTFGQKQELVFLGREISEQKDYSDETANDIDQEVHNIIQRAYGTTKRILTENKATLTKIAEELIANETLGEEELSKLFKELVPKRIYV